VISVHHGTCIWKGSLGGHPLWLIHYYMHCFCMS